MKLRRCLSVRHRPRIFGIVWHRKLKVGIVVNHSAGANFVLWMKDIDFLGFEIIYRSVYK